MKLLRRFSYFVLLMSLISCGGGSLSTGGDGNGGTTPDPIVIALALSNQNITGGVPATVTATLTQGDKVLANTLVTFTSTLGTSLSSLSGVTTDSNGVATVQLTSGSESGNGIVTATLTSGETSTIGFVIDPIVVSLALSNQNVTGQAPVTVSATVTQGSAALANTVVTFTSTLGAFSPSSGTALTDANGVATITLTAGNVRGAGTVTATLASGETQDISFTTQGDDTGIVGDINIDVTLVDNNDNPIESITSSKSGRIVATVNGITSPVIVTFSTTVGDIPIATAITDANNQATVDILAGNSLGAGTATATISSGETGQVLLVVGASNVLMGSGSPFQEGVANISLAQISAGGTTVVTVNIVDDQGNLFKEPVEVNFSSSCTSLVTPSASLSSPITTSNGIATSTYLAKGCVGDDPISVNANAGGINLSATTSVNVIPASAGSIEFVSVAPTTIGILGTGALNGAESSTVVFKVLDTDGNPVNSQTINFSLNTNVGDIKLSQSSAKSDSNGLVQTVVNSGTVATTVRVTATIAGTSPLISSQSSVLVVSTGIPDQDSFSLSADILNPEGWNLDGTEVKVTARMADAFNNPVPDGTAVSFTTEGGSIEPSCTTINGICTVTWRSQYPKPAGHILGDVNNLTHVPEDINTMGQKYGGRATVTATAIGEESFPDLNGNGRFDASEMAAFSGNNVSGLPFDLNEAFVDYNEDGVFNPTQPNGQAGGELEELIDFNSNGVFDLKDGKYNGVLCALDANGDPAHAGCSTQKSINVRRELTLVMSGSTAQFVTVLPVGGADIVISADGIANASVTISDLHNQPMPAGSTVVFSVAGSGSVVSTASFNWPNTNKNGGQTYSVTVKGEKDGLPKTGTLWVEVTSPGGAGVTHKVADILIQ